MSASASTGSHCRRVNEENAGRTALNSTIPATHCRTATTPAGPSTGNASAAVAAPNWLEAALPVISATPRAVVRMPAAWPRTIHTQNACTNSAIR